MPVDDIRSAQYEIVDHTRQSQSPLIGVIEPKPLTAPEARKGQLYVVVESNQFAETGIDAGQLVLRVVRKTYYESGSLSVTASLRQALHAANKALYQHNLNAAVSHRAYVGITCAVIKGQDLFIAQVVPSQAYVLEESKVRAMPIHPSWNPAHASAAPFMKSSSLGSSLFVEPELYRCVLRPNHGFILCSSNIAPLLKRETIEGLLKEQKPDTIVDGLYNICRQHAVEDGRALAVRMYPQLRSLSARQPLQTSGRGKNGGIMGVVNNWLATQTAKEPDIPPHPLPKPPTAYNQEHETTTPLPTTDDIPSSHDRPPQTEQHDMPAIPHVPVSPIPIPQPIDVGEPIHNGHNQQQHRLQYTKRTPPNNTDATPDETSSQTVPPYAKRKVYHINQSAVDLSHLPSLSDRQPKAYRPRMERRPWVDMSWEERLQLPIDRLYATVRDVLHKNPLQRQLERTSQPMIRAANQANERKAPPFPWLQLIALGLFVTLLIVYGINLSRQSSEQQTLDYLEQAHNYLDTLKDAPNQQVAIEQLEKADQAIELVRQSALVTTTNPLLWLPYKEVELEYERNLGIVKQLSFFDNLTLLTEHIIPTGRFATVVVPLPVATITDTHIIETQRYMYALDGDKNNAIVYRIPRDGGVPEPLLSPDDTIQNALVGQLQAIAWRIDHLVAIDQAPNNFGYYFLMDGVWNYIRLGGSEMWAPSGRIDLETYEGNLYVWGVEPGEIVKFTSGRYGDIPQLWLDASSAEMLDLSTVIDMDVDGKIYLLQPNGHVLVFSTGRFEREIVPGTLDPPLASVTRMVVTGTSEQGFIFLLDTLNERVIQINKIDGTIVQQMMVHTDSTLHLNQLIDLCVDDSGSRPVLYLINGGQIIRADLPAPPRSFE